MTAVKAAAVINSAGVLLSMDILAKLCDDEGDLLHVVERTNGFELIQNVLDFKTQNSNDSW
jgi:hypothetical protein